MENELPRLRQAFSVFYEGGNGPINKAAAQAYLDGLASSCPLANIWSQFLSLSRGTRSEKFDDEVRFWLIKCLCDRVASVSVDERRVVQQSLCHEYFCGLLPIINEVEWILTKATVLYVRLIALDYPENWPEAFKWLLQQIACAGGEEKLRLYANLLVRTLAVLDTEIIADEISSRAEQERAIAMKVKDGLRMSQDINVILSFFSSLFSGALVPGLDAQIADHIFKANKGETGSSVPSWWLALVESSLRVLATIAAWADMALMIKADYKFLPFIEMCIGHVFSEPIALAALEWLQALCYKRMVGRGKAVLVLQYNLLDMLLAELTRVSQRSLTAQHKLASVSNTVMLQLIDCLPDIRNPTKEADKEAPGSGPLTMPSGVDGYIAPKLSPAEAEETYYRLWLGIERLAKNLVGFFSSRSNVYAAEVVVPGLSEFFKLMKVGKQESIPAQCLLGVKECVGSTLAACVCRAEVPAFIDWDDIFESEDERVLILSGEEVDADGSEGRDYFICRRRALNLFKRVYTVALHNYNDVAPQFIQYLTTLATQAVQARQWKSFEAIVSLFANMLDCLKDSSRKIPEVSMGLVTDVGRLLLLWLNELVTPPSSAVLPRFLRAVLFDALASLSLFFKGGVLASRVDVKAELIAVGLSAFVSHQGVKSRDSSRLVSTAIRELLRFARALQPSDLSVIVPIVEGLVRDGFMDVRPLSDVSQAQKENLTEVMSEQIPTLSLDDQMRLFEFVGSLSLAGAERDQLIVFSAFRLMAEFETIFTRVAALDITLAIDFVSRLVRCCGNLLRKPVKSEKNAELLGRMNQIVVLSLQNIRGTDLKTTKMFQNALFLVRKMCLSFELELTVPLLSELIPLLYSTLFVVLKSAAQEEKCDRTYSMLLDSMASLLSHLIMTHKEKIAVQLFAKPVSQNKTFFDWCLEQHALGWRLLFGEDMSSELARSGPALESLSEIRDVTRTFVEQAKPAFELKIPDLIVNR